MGPQSAADTKLQAELAEVAANMRAYLKTCSKKELIRLVMEQANLVIEHQQINKILFEQNEQLKAIVPSQAQSPSQET